MLCLGQDGFALPAASGSGRGSPVTRGVGWGTVAGGIPRAVVPVTAALFGFFFFLITALLRYESHMIKFTLNVYDPRV